MANIRNPLYGIKKDQDTLTTQDPAAVLYGVTPDSKWIPIAIDDFGRIQLGSGVTLNVDNLELGDVGIVGNDPVGGLDHKLSVTNLNIDGWGLKSSLYDSVGNGITSTLASGKQALDVNVTSAIVVNPILDHTTSNILVYGFDGTSDQKIKTNALGELQVGITNPTLAVTQSGTWDINNISGTVSLPTGAATEATLSTRASELTLSGFRTDFNAVDFATETTLSAVKTDLDKFQFDGFGNLKVNVELETPEAVQIKDSLGSLINPAKEDGNLLSIKINTDNLDVLLSTRASESTLSAVKTDLDQFTFATGSVNSNITNSTLAVTQSGIWSVGRTWTLSSGSDSVSAVQSGTWNINNISGTVSLPTGAATEITLAGIKTDTDKFTFSSTRLLVDGSGVVQPISISQTGTDNNVDVVDRVVREVGRVLASDALITSETYSTTSNVYSNARPVNGDILVRHYKTKKIYIKNTSVNNGRLTILGSIDNGVTFDITVAPDAALNAGVTSITDLTDALTHIQIQVRSQTGGQTTTYVSKAYLMGI